MSDGTFASLREELAAERAALLQQLNELGAGDARLEYDSNFADTSQVTAERGETANLVQSLQKTLAEVHAALGRMDDGSFGRCENCGGDIASDRLAAQPTARRCFQCASNR